MEKFTIKEALSFGWQKTKKHFWYLAIILLGTGIFFSLLDALTKDRGFFPNLIAAIIGILVELVLIKFSLKILSDEKLGTNDLVPSWRTLWTYVVGGLLYGLIVLGGLILLIVPGIIWALKYSQYAYLIVDKGMGPVEALKESGNITSGLKGRVLLMWLSIVGIIILGALALVVGLLWAIPTGMIAWAYVYRKLADSVMPATVQSTTPMTTASPQS
jgi:uncharacterized membrane protein